jgi:FkbM family methyltransferase
MIGALKSKCKNIKNIYSLDLGVLYGMEMIDIDFVVKNKDLFQWTYNQLSDDLSRKSYIAYLNAKINKSYEFLVPYISENQYFCKDIMKIANNEVFVDCGAYDGDTILSFVNQLNANDIQSYDAIYAIEPDDANFKKLSVLSNTIQKLYCVKKGAWNEQSVLRFNSEGTMTSSASDTGNTVIEVDTIDGILSGQRATIIKMDIEGAELNALKGAEQTIRKHKPKLAISIYHKADDFITIPQYIKSLVSGYKLYFRIHKCGTIDSVLYAVCED